MHTQIHSPIVTVENLATLLRSCRSAGIYWVHDISSTDPNCAAEQLGDSLLQAGLISSTDRPELIASIIANSFSLPEGVRYWDLLLGKRYD